VTPKSRTEDEKGKVREAVREKWNVKLLKLLDGAKPDEPSLMRACWKTSRGEVHAKDHQFWRQK